MWEYYLLKSFGKGQDRLGHSTARKDSPPFSRKIMLLNDESEKLSKEERVIELKRDKEAERL